MVDSKYYIMTALYSGGTMPANISYSEWFTQKVLSNQYAKGISKDNISQLADLMLVA
jgi:hypothetical protein